MKNLLKLIELKTIITLSLTACLLVVIFGKIEMSDKLFTLFATTLSSTMAYYFNKKEKPDAERTTTESGTMQDE